MTSRKSSKIKHNSPYAFKSALSSGVFPTVLYMAFMLAFVPFSNLLELLDEKAWMARTAIESATSPLSGDYIKSENASDSFTSLAQKYVYSLFINSDETLLLTMIATIGVSILMGIFMFRFITSKKTVNVYYSLGITRTNLFISRYAAGLVLLLACIALPIVLSAVVSIALIGFSSQLMLATGYMILCIFSLAALTYSVTSAVFSSVGTSFEGAGFTVCILLIPTVFIYCIECFSARLLYGNPIDAGYFQLGKDSRYESISMIDEYGYLNPLAYLTKLLYSDSIDYGQYTLSDAAGLKEAKLNFTHDMHFIVPVAWLIVAAVATLIGIAVFKRRRAEICGFLGMNKSLNFLSSSIIGFSAFTFIVVTVVEELFTLAVTLGFAAMIVLYFVFNLIITRAPKKVFKTSYLLIPQLLSVGIILGIFASGGFGYSSKMPKAEDIESVYISPVSIDCILSEDDCYIDSFYFYNFDGNEPVYNNSPAPSTLGPYTSKDDISRALRLHSKLIELGSTDLTSEKKLNTEIMIYYTLKNGKSFARYYTKADVETLHMCLDFYNSDFYNKDIEESFFGNDLQEIESSVDYSYAKAIAVGPSMCTDSFRYMDLTEEQFNSLKRAVANDLINMSAQQFYTPEKPAIGAIIFAAVDWLGTDMNNDYLITDDELAEESEIYGNIFGADNCTIQKTVFLTQDMPETLAFLTANNLMGYFKAVNTAEVESISFRPAVIDLNEWPYSDGIDVTLNFFTRNRTVEAEYYGRPEDKYPAGDRLIDQNKIINNEQIAQVLSKAHMYYFTDNEGFICYITYTNGETVEKYLPLDDAPDFVKNYNYRLSSAESESMYAYHY